MNQWMKRGAWTLLGLTAWSGAILAQDPSRVPAGAGTARLYERSGDLPGPIDSVQDLRDLGKALFKLGDLNNDGLISQKEANDAANLLVGGFFFRADTNGDGTVSKDEARQAREAFLKQKPFLRAIMDRAQSAKSSSTGNESKANGAGNPVKIVGSQLDSNNDGQLQASEVRKAVQTTVQGLYDSADTNRDSQLSPPEINTALRGMAGSVAESVFQNADTDNNGSLSSSEFDKAVQNSANVVFRVLDANGDGQLSGEEAKEARRAVWQQIQMLEFPDASNAAGVRQPARSGSAPARTGAGASVNAPRSR
jgi:Ca2+-binding EF-hand superfamily protein